jgi:ADP-ribosyl-[dinitrogen reductase] hydrolase
MFAGIIGDVIGSVYEAHQWNNRNLDLIQELPIEGNPLIKPKFENLKWVRKDYSWTDDSLCTLALYHAYIHNEDPTAVLQDFCKRYGEESIGFGKAFKAWVENPVPYESFGNGSIMRIGFIPFLNISLEKKLDLGYEYTKISHNHEDSFAAVAGMILLCDGLQKEKDNNNLNKNCLKQYIQDYKFTKTVQSMHEENAFEMNALQTLLQAVVIVIESNSIEEVLKNCFYVGGDSDTLGCIAANIASCIYPVPQPLWDFSAKTLEKYEDLNSLVEHFSKNYQPKNWELKNSRSKLTI